jgi:hypothetical protein
MRTLLRAVCSAATTAVLLVALIPAVAVAVVRPDQGPVFETWRPYAPYTAGPIVREEFGPYAPYTAGPEGAEEEVYERIGNYLLK